MIKKSIFLNILTALVLFFSNINAAQAVQDMASAEFSINLPEFVKIAPITSPVLTANITDRTGNLYSPMMTRFRVLKNTRESKILYLKSNIITDGGYESSMFEQGGQVYVAFGNLARIPSSNALYNCKRGGMPKDSPGVVAYPVTSITGAKTVRYLPSKEKYELEVVENDSQIQVIVGSNVNRMTFAGNDPRGFYQAVLSLTDADI